MTPIPAISRGRQFLSYMGAAKDCADRDHSCTEKAPDIRFSVRKQVEYGTFLFPFRAVPCFFCVYYSTEEYVCKETCSINLINSQSSLPWPLKMIRAISSAVLSICSSPEMAGVPSPAAASAKAGVAAAVDHHFRCVGQKAGPVLFISGRHGRGCKGPGPLLPEPAQAPVRCRLCRGPVRFCNLRIQL